MDRNMKIECKLHYNAAIYVENVTVLSGALTCRVCLYYNSIDDNGGTVTYDDYDIDRWIYHGKEITKHGDQVAIREHYSTLGIDITELVLAQLPKDEFLSAVVIQQINK